MSRNLISVWCICYFGLLASKCQAQECKLPEDGTDEAMPDIFNLFITSASFLVEANYNHLRRTHYITETYDKTNRRGLLHIEIEGKITSVLYFNDTNEYFEYTSTDCSSSKISDLDEKKFTSKFVGWNWINKDPKETVIGPSNMFHKAYLQASQEVHTMVKERDPQFVRGMTTNVWTWCYRDVKVQFYFSDPTKPKESPLGLKNMAVPVRLTVEGPLDGTMIRESFEFVNMRLEIPKAELDLRLAIPPTLGCQRKAENLKKAPDYTYKDMIVEAELIYTPLFNNTQGFTYTSNFKIAVDQKNGLASVDFAPWKAQKNNEMARPGDEVLRVWDVKNGLFVYETDQITGTCKVNMIQDKYSILTLPDGSRVDFADWDLFLMGTDSSSFQYLGETVERGIRASVFEKVRLDDKTLDSVTITRYHVADDIVMDNEFQERQAPLKVIVYSITLGDDKFLGKLEVNFYGYDRAVTRKTEAFDVTACFTDKEQSRWFQIVYPMDGVKPKDVIPKIPAIQSSYAALLYTDANTVPYRIPKTMVDVDSDNIYITGLILERPDFLLDFNATKGIGFKEGNKYTRKMGLTNVAGCAKACLESPLCSYFSYCGALCTILENDINPPTDIITTDGCEIHSKIVENHVPTLDQISKSLASAVRGGKLKITLFGTGNVSMDFTALQYRDNIAFGLNGLEERPEGTEKDRFSVYKYGASMDKSFADEGKASGRISLSTCQQACYNKESCQSFSYCQLSSDCFLSSKHGEEIPDDKFTQSTQCMTLNRNYLDYFNTLPGLTLGHQAEKMVDVKSIEGCAKACVQEKDFICKSFDFCSLGDKDGVKDCWLHKEHFSEIKESQEVKPTEECGHYSRKYLLDFRQERHRDLTRAGDGAVLTDLDAEACATACIQNEGFTCLGFDYCDDPFQNKPVCTLRTTASVDLTASNWCNAYLRTGKVKVQKDTGGRHSKAAAGGLGFLMLLIGLAVGFGGIYAFGYWRANKK